MPVTPEPWNATPDLARAYFAGHCAGWAAALDFADAEVRGRDTANNIADYWYARATYTPAELREMYQRTIDARHDEPNPWRDDPQLLADLERIIREHPGNPTNLEHAA